MAEIKRQQYGEMNEDGTMKRNALLCAVSGDKLVAGSVRRHIANTNLFYRANPGEWRSLSQAQRSALDDAVVAAASPEPEEPKKPKKRVRKSESTQTEGREDQPE